jgi:hypothetical protein
LGDDATRKRKTPKAPSANRSNSPVLKRPPLSPYLMMEAKPMGPFRGMTQRDAHNAMERERRVQLRENFEALRSEVPTLHDTDKAATLQILREATTFIQRMREEEKQLMDEKAQLIAVNEALRKQATLIHDDDDSDVPPLFAPPS